MDGVGINDVDRFPEVADIRLDVVQHLAENRLAERIEQEKNDILVREPELGGIAVFDVPSLPFVAAAIDLQVFLRRFMQLPHQLDADDFSEKIERCRGQDSSLLACQ